MNKLEIFDEGGGHLTVRGDLTFSTIGKEAIKSLALLSATKPVMIDLGHVSSTDSAGLALMIEWIKLARTHRTPLSFKKIPQQLLNLAKLSGLDTTHYFTAQSDD